MREVDNMNAIRFQKVEIKKDKPKKSAAPEGSEDNIEFQNAKAASLGRSQVSKPDNIESDIGYEGKFRKDFISHTGYVNLKYNF